MTSSYLKVPMMWASIVLLLDCCSLVVNSNADAAAAAFAPHPSQRNSIVHQSTRILHNNYIKHGHHHHHQSSTTRTRSRTRSRNAFQLHMNMMDSSDDNDKININISTSAASTSRSLTPNHILHPLYFPYNATNTKQYEQAVESLSLPMALQKMTQTLESIIAASASASASSSESSSTSQIDLKLGGNLFPAEEEINGMNGGFNGVNGGVNGVNGHTATPKTYTIQIIQQINHPIDTLCWLHANKPRIDALSIHAPSQPPILYLSNVENTYQAASIGSALTINYLNDKWDFIASLPAGSGVYGGKRFDVDVEGEIISDEWKDFGREMWVLPSVELRQENRKRKRVGTGTSTGSSSDYEMSLLVHLHFTQETCVEEARRTLSLIQKLTADVSTSVPCTTLAPILSRGYNPDAQDVFEKGVNAALDRFQSQSQSQVEGDDPLDKVVLARRADLHFGAEVNGLDVMKRLKFGGSVGGHLFYMNPGGAGAGKAGKEFLGCSPERLFQVRGEDGMVMSEALAGTRPRGSTSEADAELMRDLMHSEKDREENIITGEFIRGAFESLREKGVLDLKDDGRGDTDEGDGVFFVRRLRHLQHICQSFEGKMTDSGSTVDIARYLLDKLHPTPAVCGSPGKESMEFIRQYESISFDRGMYAGPFGFLGSSSADIIVAIRSALLTKNVGYGDGGMNNVPPSNLSIYAGAGIVPGSTVQGEWSETGYKLGVLSSVFAQSPLTLKSFQTPNEAWANAFVEELIRSGVTQFYVCPGSRSTPMTAALARAMRSHVGIIDCISTHDERGAAFRALGYARATKRAAAVITSSGTAVANLYPAVMEAGMDGIPMLLLTADRPYEDRDTGANQAVDQIKVRATATEYSMFR